MEALRFISTEQSCFLDLEQTAGRHQYAHGMTSQGKRKTTTKKLKLKQTYLGGDRHLVAWVFAFREGVKSTTTKLRWNWLRSEEEVGQALCRHIPDRMVWCSGVARWEREGRD